MKGVGEENIKVLHAEGEGLQTSKERHFNGNTVTSKASSPTSEFPTHPSAFGNQGFPNWASFLRQKAKGLSFSLVELIKLKSVRSANPSSASLVAPCLQRESLRTIASFLVQSVCWHLCCSLT